ncbi:hypothetical protein [Odoribacter lunatus]|uniref:hypothetical protein n=1 Tax=Odoribacter lunatus TaxID=2941335 RepID=UPI00203DEFFD|nr:hypothetical protein [Odoribacter lunatus]
MNRGIITISETGAVTMPDVPVWMTLPEIADLLGVFECDVCKAVKSIYKNKELDEFDTAKYVRLPNGISYDVYSLEMVIAVSFRIQGKGCHIFRQYVMKRLYSGNKECIVPSVYFIVHGEVFNRKGRDKGGIYN